MIRAVAISLKILIEKGLRAQLGMQSFITGQLIIELNFYPGTPVVLKSIEKEYIEIPTIPSTSAKLADALEKLDLKKLEKTLESTLAGIDRQQLIRAMIDYREDRRVSVVMNRVAKGYNDAEIAAIADYFSKIK
jgi:paraquat-inducible protein B